MVFPRMPPRMKQLSNHICLGIEPGEICSFVKIAIDTGKGEIFDIVTAAVNFRNDVFNVQRGERRINPNADDSIRKRFEHAGEPEP